MKQAQKLIQKLKRLIRALPNHKHYFDFLIAILSVPALITALILNINSLRRTNPTSAPPPIPTNATPTNVSAPVRTITKILSPQATSSPQCTQGIGSISIASPQEGQTVTDNPLCIEIDYNPGNYCSVVWKYQINGGAWSDYGDNAACFYNLPNGQNTFELQVKSLTSSTTQTLSRSFIYQSPTQQVQPTQTSTPTASFTPTPTSSTSATHQ